MGVVERGQDGGATSVDDARVPVHQRPDVGVRSDSGNPVAIDRNGRGGWPAPNLAVDDRQLHSLTLAGDDDYARLGPNVRNEGMRGTRLAPNVRNRERFPAGWGSE